MKGKDILRDLAAAGPPAPLPPRPENAKAAGAVRAMNLGLERLTNDAARARELQETLSLGQTVVEIEPARIDPSFIADRIPTDHDPAYAELKRSIEANGQQVPVLVRPHPKTKDRYQAAYGHRRIRAAAELGRPIRAIVKSLNDAELIIAQAQENGPRLDLSFIERSHFASRLESHGFTRDTIGKVLGVDIHEVSRLLTVSQRIDSDLVLAIGPAPRIGRPRWLNLADALDDAGAVARARAAAGGQEFVGLDSNMRFNQVLAAARPATEAVKARQAIASLDGKEIGWIEKTRGTLRFAVRDRRFAVFLEAQLPALLKDYAAAQAPTGTEAEKKRRKT